MNQNDRRVQRTKKALHNALMELLTEKDLNQITIKELTDKADIHRVTFYSHYQDIYELYEEVKKTILDDISHFVDTDTSHTYEEYFIRTTDYYYDHKWFCQLLFTDNALWEKAMDIWEENYLKIWLFEDHLTTITEDMRYMTSYNIVGCSGIIRRWWRRGFRDPKEKIVAYLRRANRIFDAVSIITE